MDDVQIIRNGDLVRLLSGDVGKVVGVRKGEALVFFDEEIQIGSIFPLAELQRLEGEDVRQ